MSDFFRRHSLALTSLALVIISCQLMSASIQHQALGAFGGRMVMFFLSPCEEVVHNATDSMSGMWRHYVWLQSVESERNELALRVKALESQNSKLLELEGENERLKSLLKYEGEMHVEGVAARVIGHEPSNWYRTIVIDRGESHGVRVGSSVVDGNAIVGQVIATSSSSARVLLITDNSSAIDALVQSSRGQGIVEGALENSLKLRFVLREYAVSIGDRIIASGLDGVFPKGALIGVVTRTEQSSGMFHSIDVQPAVDVRRLETVLVVTKQLMPDTEVEKSAGEGHPQ